MQLKGMLFAALVVLACGGPVQAHASAAAVASQTDDALPATADARAVLDRAFAAMGGRKLLAGLHSLKLDLRTVDYRIDDSERADGPYWLNIGLGTAWMDEAHARSRTELDAASAQWPLDVIKLTSDDMVAQGVMWQGKRVWYATPLRLIDAAALQPERLLLTASAAAELQRLPDQTVHGQRQYVLAFTYKGHAVRLYVDSVLDLPSRLAVKDAYKGGRLDVMLGDIVWRRDYLFYKRQSDGFVYPHQTNLFRNGKPYATTVVTGLTENASPPVGGYAPPASAKLAPIDANTIYGSVRIDPKNMQPLADHAWLVKGAWNVMVVRQPDGLVVIEAPQSSAHSAQVLDLLGKRFPDVPVKALVSTTDSTWHIAGVRTYVARGIPVYVLDANKTRLAREIGASHSQLPDALSRHPRPADLRVVSDKTTIGTGPTQLDIYPIRGHGDERMMMVYMPGEHLLYGSSNDVNLKQKPKPRATFNAFELVRRVRMLELPVQHYVAIHTAKMPWDEFRHIVLTQPAISSE
ncbi:MAG: hypothetical protein ACREPY_09700 [Rhodanobacteraceae bacterium]